MVKKLAMVVTIASCLVQGVYSETFKATTAEEIRTNASKLKEGDSLIIAKGTYAMCTSDMGGTLVLSQSGTKEKRIYFGTVGSDRAVLDFSKQKLESTNIGVALYGNYWTIHGVDVKGAGDNGMLIENPPKEGGGYENKGLGSYNKIINCNFYENKDSGLQLKNWASHDTIINCDSYFNYDPTSGGNADGFAPKLNPGHGIFFYACRAWNNSDDGWDGYLKDDRPQVEGKVVITLEKCIAYHNGFTKENASKGNGNGFKMGSKILPIDWVNRFCIAVNNKSKGFDANSNEGKMTMLNCSAYKNGFGESKPDYMVETGSFVAKNCNAVAGSKGISLKAPGEQITNVWTCKDEDFESVKVEDLIAPRNSNGSYSEKTLAFMRPKKTASTLVDKGTDVGLPSSGKPDIGWIELGMTAIEKPVSEMSILKSHSFISSTSKIGADIINVNFTALSPGELSLAVFDITGQKLLHTNSNISAGTQSQIVDLGNSSSGMYICDFSYTSKDGVKKDRLKLFKK